jgi:hypothetical protein
LKNIFLKTLFLLKLNYLKQFLYNITNWEKWPFKVIYFPLTFLWLYYIIKSRAVWFFTPSNPTITFGGFEGEGKREMYDQLPLNTFPKTIYIQPSIPFEKALEEISKNGFTYPYIVKPENGMMGLLFRIIENENELKKYHFISPVEYIVQGFSDYPVEVSIFYYRHPTQSKGVVSGFIQKEYMQVKGDGVTSLKTLIEQHPKANLKMDEMESKHGANFDKILLNNEVYFLSYAGNHNRGAKFMNLYNQIDEKLVALCDTLSTNKNMFYYGRFDIKCASIEDLKNQKNFSILEYNGAGAEPNHIYDCGFTLLQAYKEIAKHWKAMYDISKYNNSIGHKYWSFHKGKKFLREAEKLLKTLKQKDLELGA